MAREKSDKKTEKPVPIGTGAEKDKPIKNVKVTEAFHRKLKTIAASVGKELGEIIEAEMKDFIDREWKRLKESD